MVDRHDIDALLIGSLYGELSSADEARLRAHLESHPADRTALEDLTRARQAVRASRIFEVQLEPPQSVSALLLQEAARRAPRPAREEAREGWFAWLRRSFLMHPAFAAAAMFVVVVGVAGTLYMRKGDHVAMPEVAGSEHATGSAFATAPAAPAAAAAPEAAPENIAQVESDAAASRGAKLAQDGRRDKDSFRVGLADNDGDSLAEQQAKPEPKPAPRPKADPAPAAPAPASSEKAKAARTAGPRAMEVTTPRPAPKELEGDAPARRAVKSRPQPEDAKPTEAVVATDPSDQTRRDNLTIPGRAPAVAPPPPKTPDSGFSKAPGAPAGGAVGGAGAGATGGEDKLGVVDADLAWAKDQHTRLRNQVKAGNCVGAAGTAVSLSTRAPGYYQQNVESDRDVKNCLAYINTERDKAERSRATAGRALEEATVPAQPAQSPPRKAAAKKPPPAKAGGTAGSTSKSAPAKADTTSKEAPASKN